ncbi:MAG: class I SAM-dependent methyltransferase [Acidimicrobiales bacterium]
MGELHRDEFRAGQYFVGVAGMAMMRRILARPSEGLPRLDDVRRVLDSFDEFPNDIVVEVVEHDLESGYERWASSYDGHNPLVEAEARVVRPMLDALPAGRVLDAACGTGRHAGYLAGLGHDTIGVDVNAAMLRVARERFPAVDFKAGRLQKLPIDDDAVDVVTCALALCHVSDLGPVFAEFARVLRPGGTLIVSDPHPTSAHFGGVAGFPDRGQAPENGFRLPFVENLAHPVHTYVNSAVGAGLRIDECVEVDFPEDALAANPAAAVLPDAVGQAFGGLPFLLVWRCSKLSR